MKPNALTASCLFLLVLAGGLFLRIPAQSKGGDAAADAAAPRMPRWLQLRGEIRGRLDVAADPQQSIEDRFYLNRLRFQAAVSARSWLSFSAEFQDSSAFSLAGGGDSAPLRDQADVRLAYADVGVEEGALRLRLGRQELPYADEMLLGADNEWDPIGYTFDALHLRHRRGALVLDAFTGYCVRRESAEWDGWDRSNRIAGLVATLAKGGRDDALVVYVLWKRGQDSLDLLQTPGHRDVVTEGVRVAGALRPNVDYTVEVAMQQGHVVQDAVRAWASHWDLGWKPLGPEVGPRIAVTYNYASGDANPRDGQYGTFDDLYPAGFNAYGLPDPYAWRNLSTPEISASLPLNERWEMQTGYRGYWLATTKDGLYPGGDAFLVRNENAGSSFLGSQWFVSAGYRRARNWTMQAGYGRMFAGAYLEACDLKNSLSTVFLQTTLTF
jgi:hypothetical protein